MFATTGKGVVTSGLAFLDAQLGGLPAGEVCLVSGGADTGKTILTLQFLIEGLKNGEKVVLVTSSPPEQFISLAEQVDLSVADYLYHNQLIIVHQKTQSRGVIGTSEELRVMLDSLENEILPWEPWRMAIDSVVPLIALFRKDFLKLGLTTMFKSWSRYGLTTLLTTRMPASGEAMLVRRMLEDQAAASLHLDEHIHPDGEARRRMVVRKMAHIVPPYPVYDFQIESGVGIHVTAKRETSLESPKQQGQAAIAAKPVAASASATGLMLSSESQGVFDKLFRKPEPPARPSAYDESHDDVTDEESAEQQPMASGSSSKPASASGFSFRM